MQSHFVPAGRRYRDGMEPARPPSDIHLSKSTALGKSVGVDDARKPRIIEDHLMFGRPHQN